MAILAVIIGAVWLIKARTDTDDTSLVATTTTNGGNNANTPGSGAAGTNGSNVVGMKSTLGGIFDDPGSYQCDYEQVSQTSRSTNVVYVANGKLRGEFRTKTATSTTLSMVVYDGSYLYVWTEGQPTGKVTQPRTIADLPSAIPEDITSGRILGSSATNVSWICHAWSKDLTKLVKPSYVTFR